VYLLRSHLFPTGNNGTLTARLKINRAGSGAMANSRVQLRDILIQGYRSCERTTLSLEPGVTVLIGPNGAGKTNIMHGLRLLGRVTRRADQLREGDQHATHSQFKASFDFKRQKVGLKIDYSMARRAASIQRLQKKERWDFSSFGISQRWTSIVDAEIFFEGAGIEGNYALIRQPGETTYEPLNTETQKAFDAIAQFRQGIQYYSASQFTNPTLCPTSFEVDEDGLAPDPVGPSRSKHIVFLRRLFRTSTSNKELYASYLSLIGRGGINLVDDIKWEKTTFSNASYEVKSGGNVINQKRKRTLIIPMVVVSGRQLSFDQLSEGTFRALATIFHIMTDQGSMLLLEEPEVCVHHGLLASLVEIIKDFGQKKQIVISTHSEAVLDAFEPEQVRLVRISKASGTKADKLSTVMSRRRFAALKTYLQTEGNLGEYWRFSDFGQ